MTRFFTTLGVEPSCTALRDACASMGHTWKQTCTNQVPGLALQRPSMTNVVHLSSVLTIKLLTTRLISSDFLKAWLKLDELSHRACILMVHHV